MEDIEYNIWLPRVVYDNTDQKEVTRLGMDWEWSTTVAVTREEENPERSQPHEVDETEYFQGANNTLTMNQTYTWEFQCKYELQHYPFDTQVCELGPIDIQIYKMSQILWINPCKKWPSWVKAAPLIGVFVIKYLNICIFVYGFYFTSGV